MDDFNCGIGFGTFGYVKMKFSNKDLLLLFGILIAVIVTLTTMVFSEGVNSKGSTSQNSIKPSTSLAEPSVFIRRAIDKIEFRLLIR
jgi:hypothetical protein